MMINRYIAEGAEIKNFLQLKKHMRIPKIIRLEKNYDQLKYFNVASNIIENNQTSRKKLYRS